MKKTTDSKMSKSVKRLQSDSKSVSVSKNAKGMLTDGHTKASGSLLSEVTMPKRLPGLGSGKNDENEKDESQSSNMMGDKKGSGYAKPRSKEKY